VRSEDLALKNRIKHYPHIGPISSVDLPTFLMVSSLLSLLRDSKRS